MHEVARKGGLEVFDDLGGDDVGRGQVGAVFEAWKARPLLHPRYGDFEPEPSCLGSGETDGKAERLTERGREGINMSKLSYSGLHGRTA